MFKRPAAHTSAASPERLGFTPRQIIELVLVVGLLVVALPIGVQAATSLVTIKDSSTATKARVDSATSALRVGGITNELANRTGTTDATFTVSSSAYSQIRIFAEHPGCSGYCDTLTVQCVEGTTRTCDLVSAQSFDQNGYNVLQAVPGRTLRVTVKISFGVGSWHVVIYGRAP
jgi:hypothetical protein